MSRVNAFPPDWWPLPLVWWAEFYGVTEGTIREWIDRYQIKYAQPGRDRLVRPADMFSRVPWVDLGNPEPPKD